MFALRRLWPKPKPKPNPKSWFVKQPLIHFYITVIRPVLEYCAPAWHYALTKAQSESLEAIQKRAIHITHNPTRGMPYSSMLYCANLDSLASHREDISRDFFP